MEAEGEAESLSEAGRRDGSSEIPRVEEAEVAESLAEAVHTGRSSADSFAFRREDLCNLQGGILVKVRVQQLKLQQERMFGIVEVRADPIVEVERHVERLKFV